MDLKQIIRMHMRFSTFSHNLDYFKEKYPEECRQVEKELAEDAAKHDFMIFMLNADGEILQEIKP